MWLPDLTTGNCNNIICSSFSDCCNHLLIIVITLTLTLTFDCNINSCAGHLFGLSDHDCMKIVVIRIVSLLTGKSATYIKVTCP